MDAARQTQIGQTVGLDLFSRKWTGTAIVVARREDLVFVHAAVAERWRSLLAALSSGIAHADPNEDTSAREKALAAVEETNALPADVTVAYAVAPLGSEWRAQLGAATIVEVP